MERTCQGIVELGHSRLYAQIDCLVTDVDDKPTKNVGVDLVPLSDGGSACNSRAYLVGDLEDLGSLGGFGLLQGGFQTCQDVLGKRGSGGNGEGNFTLVLGKELVESLNHALGLAQTTILRQHSQEVLGDVRICVLLRASALEFGKDSGEALGAVCEGESGVVDEARGRRVLLENAGEAGQLGVDLCEGLGRFCESGAVYCLGVLCGDGGGGAAAQARGRR